MLGELGAERIAKFKELLAIGEKYKHKSSINEYEKSRIKNDYWGV